MTKTVLITGCSSGFGKATADLFLAKGWNVVATMRSPRPGVFADSDRLLVTALDVTRPDTVDQAIAAGIARFGKIDVLVNNAGIGMLSAIEGTPDDIVRRLFETNTFGVIAAARAIIPHMRQRGAGTIVNVTSSVGIAPMPLSAAYTASKYAIEGFSEALAYELSAVGVRVKIVQPGYAPTTSFTSNTKVDFAKVVPAPYTAYLNRYFAAMQNLTAFTMEADVAEAVYAAATEDSARLRYPAGADSAMLAEMRRQLPEPEFIARIHGMTGGTSP